MVVIEFIKRFWIKWISNTNFKFDATTPRGIKVSKNGKYLIIDESLYKKNDECSKKWYINFNGKVLNTFCNCLRFNHREINNKTVN